MDTSSVNSESLLRTPDENLEDTDHAGFRRSKTHQQRSSKITPMAAFNLMVNVLMGTGPIYLPGPFLGDGWLMSTICLVAIAILSWICAEFVIEAMSNFNALMYHSKCLQTSQGDDTTNVEDNADEEDNDSVDMSEGAQSDREFYSGKSKMFKLRTIAEFGQMSRYMWGKKMDIAVTCILYFYLIGVLISKTIVSSNILSGMFDNMSSSGVPVLNNYYFWMCIFSCTAIFLSFKDIAGIKIVQVIVVIFRFTVIGLLILGPFYLICKGEGGGLTPRHDGVKYEPFHLSGFEDYFSTAIFGLLCHHSIPSMLSNVRPAKSIKSVNYVSFILGCVLFIVISIMGIAAFQGTMLEGDNKSQFTENFYGQIDWIYYISSFYMFLNVAAFPVIVITTRNNIMKCFAPHKIPKQSWKMTKATVLTTCVVVVPIAVLSIAAKDNIEDVIAVVGGVFGVVLMMLIPSIVVIGTRKRLENIGINVQDNPHKATFTNNILPYVIFVIGIACLIFNVTEDIIGWVNGSD